MYAYLGTAVTVLYSFRAPCKRGLGDARAACSCDSVARQRSRDVRIPSFARRLVKAFQFVSATLYPIDTTELAKGAVAFGLQRPRPVSFALQDHFSFAVHP